MKYLLLSTMALVFGNLHAQSNKTATKQITLFFDVDESEMDSSQKQRLIGFTKKLRNDRIVSIQIEGHTDSRSSKAYNERLSAERVKDVKTQLLSLGFMDSVFKTSWHGETLPAEPNTSEGNMKTNRRVLVSVLCERADAVNMTQLFESLVPETIVEWNAQSDTIIYGANGTILRFPKGALKPCDGCKYEIRIREIYDPGAMYLASLTTTSFQHFLRSDGMLEVRAYKNGEIIENAPLKPFHVLMPTDTLDTDMKLFYGSKTTTGLVNWHSPRPVDGIAKATSSGEPIITTNLQSMELSRREIIRWYLNRLLGRDKRKREKSRGNVEDDVSGYRESRDRMIKAKNMTPDKLAKIAVNREDLDYYSFQSNRWGYMNMDAYMKLPQNEKVNMRVLTDVSGNKTVKAMFTGYMSLIPERLAKDGYVYASLPKNRPITLVATEVRNGYAYLAVEHVKASKEYQEDFEYEKCELKDLRAAINRKLVWNSTSGYTSSSSR